MKANCWMGTRHVQVEDVPDPQILNPRDAIIRVTSTAICGSDLHLYNGFMPTMKRGDVARSRVHGRSGRVGQRRHATSRSATASSCRSRSRAVTARSASARLYSLCENSNPNAWMAEKMWGYSPCGIFGYSHMLGGYAGGQAEYARVPFADVGPLKVPDELERRAGAVPVRHFPDRLHGGGGLRHPAGRRRRGLGLRAGRPVRDQERVPARRRAGDRHRSLRVPAADGARAAAAPRRSTTRRSTCTKRCEEMTGGRGPGLVHRCGRAWKGTRPASRAPTTR